MAQERNLTKAAANTYSFQGERVLVTIRVIHIRRVFEVSREVEFEQMAFPILQQREIGKLHVSLYRRAIVDGGDGGLAQGGDRFIHFRDHQRIAR